METTTGMDNGAAGVDTMRGSVRLDEIRPHMQRGLLLLAQAYEYATDLQRNIWDFAVEIESFRRVDMTNSDLRWLVCKNLVEHAREVGVSGEKGRVFRHGSDLSFSKRTCFVLTPAGSELAKDLPPLKAPGVTEKFASQAEPENDGPLRPRWDCERQEFRLGDQLVKEFKLPSPNQETILMAFEEEGWPHRIDDPLPPHPEMDSKRRLHDTIKSLNRNQKRRLVRFMGDGSGQGVRWDLIVNESSDSNNSDAPK